MPPKRKGTPLYQGMPERQRFDDPENQELAVLMAGLNMVSNKMPRFDEDIPDDAFHKALDEIEGKPQKRKKRQAQPIEWVYAYKPYFVKRRKGNEYVDELVYTEKKQWYQRPRPLDTTQIIKY
tara:strand:- start:916 stop:1284 length:369 start_codon:yes stop_codon:yes gene_type:complete